MASFLVWPLNERVSPGLTEGNLDGIFTMCPTGTVEGHPFLPGPLELVVPVPERPLKVGKERVVLDVGRGDHCHLRLHVAEHRL